MKDAAFEADYVIVGAGSAGCVLANRLSADPAVRVLLIEAGGDDRPLHNPRKLLSNLWIHVPVGYSKTIKDPAVNWMYMTEPDVDGRRIFWPRGKTLGGSSSINGLLYVRGQCQDFDGWRQLGCDGWGWDDIAPYFSRAQHRENAAAGDWHGRGGPLHVSDPVTRHPVSQAVLAACGEAGIAANADYNSAEQEGAGWFQLTIRNGRRVSAAVAYLHPVMDRLNLRIVTDALATRILLDGRRATGVAFRHDGGEAIATARCEVILAGGTVNSPQLLELSGIGDPAILAAAGVPVAVALPGVGRDLQDHYILPMQYRLKAGVHSINEDTRGLSLIPEAFKYLFGGGGLLALSSAHIAAFCRSRPELATPDLQFHVLPATTDVGHAAKTGKLRLEREPGLTLAPCHLRPDSRGTIHIASPDPGAAPRIAPNYLSAHEDQRAMIAAVAWGRKIAAQPALAPLIDHALAPTDDLRTDDAILAYARSSGTTVYHPTSTCRMGCDPLAVVDPALCVHGIDGLRVVDASVMPRIVSGNTNAATIAIAEKAADLILAARRDAAPAMREAAPA